MRSLIEMFCISVQTVNNLQFDVSPNIVRSLQEMIGDNHNEQCENTFFSDLITSCGKHQQLILKFSQQNESVKKGQNVPGSFTVNGHCSKCATWTADAVCFIQVAMLICLIVLTLLSFSKNEAKKSKDLHAVASCLFTTDAFQVCPNSHFASRGSTSSHSNLPHDLNPAR